MRSRVEIKFHDWHGHPDVNLREKTLRFSHNARDKSQPTEMKNDSTLNDVVKTTSTVCCSDDQNGMNDGTFFFTQLAYFRTTSTKQRKIPCHKRLLIVCNQLIDGY
jgi:hypothetical protein